MPKFTPKWFHATRHHGNADKKRGRIKVNLDKANRLGRGAFSLSVTLPVFTYFSGA